jgi:hypothetical protein
MATLSWYAFVSLSESHSNANVFWLVWWYHHVPRYFRSYAEGNHRTRPVLHEGQDHCSSRAKILCLDWWFHLSISVHLPADVDLEAGVRREWSLDCAPQMFLRYGLCFFYIISPTAAIPQIVLLQFVDLTDQV